MEVTPSPQERVLERIRARTAEPARIFFAPGRANLLGAHMDYNGGQVMPVALSKGTYAAVAPRADGIFRLVSEQFPGEPVELTAEDLQPHRTRAWSAYAEGALYEAMKAWGPLPGLDVELCADLPMAKGLSSSASVECVLVEAMAAMLGVNADVEQRIRLAHAAETEYVGVRCGILDQTAIFLGRANHVLLFDCLELTREHLPLDGNVAEVAIMDTGTARELASSAFNQRVAECTRALSILQEQLPGLTCLRDLHREDFEEYRELLAPPLRRRAEHVVSEVERSERGAASLRGGDVAGFGAQMSGAHASLRDLYEVSTDELDAMVEAALESEGCYGGRLTGAGFGGCVAALVHPDAREAFERGVVEGYRARTGLPTAVQWFRPAGGPQELDA